MTPTGNPKGTTMPQTRRTAAVETIQPDVPAADDGGLASSPWLGLHYATENQATEKHTTESHAAEIS